MEFHEMFELCENLQKSLEKQYGYLDHFNHCTTANSEEIAAWCKLCMERSVYNSDDGSHIKLKTHIRFHVAQLEEFMEEKIKKEREADEVEKLRRHILNNAESTLGFWEYFEHDNLEDSERPSDRLGVCRLCRDCVYYVLGESVSNLREHFDGHVTNTRLKAKEKEKGKNKANDGSSSSKN